MVSPNAIDRSSDDLPACSYIPVPDGPHSGGVSAEPDRRHLKGVLVIFCGLLVLVSLVAFNGYRDSNGHGDHVSLPTLITSNENEELNPKTVVPLPTWQPSVSRGVSAGVSEKSNRLFTGNIGVGESYPWNNSMLSWQRTAFHFQPEKNWMNGNSFSSSFIYLFCLIFSAMAWSKLSPQY